MQTKAFTEAQAPVTAAGFNLNDINNVDAVLKQITDKMEAEPIDYHGSAHLNAYQSADGMAYFPVGIYEIKKGDFVNVRPL